MEQSRGGAGGSICLVSGSGGASDIFPPQIRRFLDRSWSDWDDTTAEMVGYSSEGDEKYRTVPTALGREIRRLKKLHPNFATIREFITSSTAVPVLVAAKLFNYGIQPGMDERALEQLCQQEESAYQRKLLTERERQRRDNILAAVLHRLNAPWLPSEQRLGRRLDNEDCYDGLAKALCNRGFHVTPDAGGLLVRPGGAS